jgi:hypothetical protein
MAETSTIHAPSDYETVATQEELKCVKDVVAAFVVALKTYSLYPKNHSICRNSVSKVQSLLNGFFDRYHYALRLDIQKESLLFKKEVVHRGQTEVDNWAFILFRDGIQWLEFEEGVDSAEITAFLKILNSCKKLKEEAESDLVTALWEQEFSGLRYKAVELNWDAEPVDLSLPRARHEERGGAQGQEREGEEQTHTAVMEFLKDGAESLMKLTPEEAETLRAMISEEEDRDTSQDLLDVVLAILDDQDEEWVFTEVLNFLVGEFRDILEQGEFRFAYKFLRSLSRARITYKSERSWAGPLLGQFLKTISSPEILGVLSEIWPTMDILDKKRIGLLRQVLLLLPAEAIATLAPMLLEIRSWSLQRQLMEVIGILAKRDLRPLERLLSRPEEFLVKQLVFIMADLNDGRVDELLRKMTHHPSEQVRRQALKALLARDPNTIEELFPFIEDPGESVERLMLDTLGKAKNLAAERLLLEYLGRKKFRISDPRHLLDCYRTLGRCGSSRSTPFLEKLLFKRGWMPGFGKSIHRQGALKALHLLGTKEAVRVLEKASRSLLPGVRMAFRKAKMTKGVLF